MRPLDRGDPPGELVHRERLPGGRGRHARTKLEPAAPAPRDS